MNMIVPAVLLCVVGCSKTNDYRVKDMRTGLSSTCQVHHVEMRTTIVPIDFGLPVIEPERPFDQVEARLFPHTEKHVFGGSCFSPDGITKAQIYVCPECESTKCKWLDEMAHRTIEENPASFAEERPNNQMQATGVPPAPDL